jgi:ATP-dependent helicase/nuclease subunit A
VALWWGPLDDLGAARVAHVRRVLEQALDAVDARKRRAKALAFADLETHAARALEDADVQADVHARWRAVLLDEAQDVNPTQAALLDALRAPDAPLTAVGDAKQSIYGFRGAEPAVLAGLRRRVAAQPDGRVVELRTSYRTHTALVEALNRVFDRALGEAAGPLAAVRSPPPGALPPLRRRTLPDAIAGAPADVRAAAEADAIGDVLTALLAAEPPLWLDDATAPGGRRRLGVDDVAVLARGRAALALLEARLPARGVPVLNAGGGDVLRTPTGLDVRALLRAVVDPTDAVAVAALLRSPFVAASDAAITRFATAPVAGASPVGDASARARPWWRRLEAADDPDLRFAAALLGELQARRAAGHGRASELLRLADDRTGVRAVLAHLPQGSRRVADFDGMLALLERLEGGQADALGVVRRLERYAAAGVAVARPPLRARGAVSLLTMHAAKGLEWPVVVVADLGGRGRQDAPDVFIDPTVGVALRARDQEGESVTYRFARAAQAAQELEEARRLAYVAFTRARDVLIVSDRGGKAAGLAAALGDALDASGVAAEPVAIDAATASAPVPPLPPAPDPPDPHDPLWRRGA